jgi:Fe-S-cluster-containing hydrogenase component 2
VKLSDHPTVRKHNERRERDADKAPPGPLDAKWLRQLSLDCGAEDAGVVEIGRAALDDQRDEILRFFPWTKSLLSFVCRMNRESVRSPARSLSNLEFHHAGDRVNEVARRVVSELERRGILAVNPSMGFPMEMDHFPGKIWIVAHKPVAVAAGLGHMGIHRNVIHPKFGNFILLGTVLIDREATDYDQPVDYNPCLECKLCVAACPVGAIAPDGHFDFSACYTHNYREFLGGFTDWVGTVADSRNRKDYRRRVKDSESASVWQSLSVGPNYKAAYCLSVCPAGEDIIGRYLDDKKGYLTDTVRPLQDKEEPVYVVAGSDAEAHVNRRFPHKSPRRVNGSIAPRSIDGFLQALPHVFQRGQSKGLDAVYHFAFTGDESREATVVIRDQSLTVSDGHVGQANLRITADSATWLGFLGKQRSLVWALLRRRIRLHGPPRLLVRFGRCFPS